MPEWLVERGIGEDRALLVQEDRVLAAKIRWPGELEAGQPVEAKLVARNTGSQRGTARTADGTEILVDRLPKDISEGATLGLVVTRAPVAERGRLKRAQARPGAATAEPGPFEQGRTVRRFPPGLWNGVWGAAQDRTLGFPGGTLLLDVTPGMTVVDIDGALPARELALAAVPAVAQAVRWFDLGGSIAIDLPTLPAKADRQAVDAALEGTLADWPHERTAMNGFGLVQLVARLQGPSLLHRLAHRRTAATARYLLRQAEGLDGAGALLITANPAVLAALEPEWLVELERRTAREARLQADGALALEGGHAQIVSR